MESFTVPENTGAASLASIHLTQYQQPLYLRADPSRLLLRSSAKFAADATDGVTMTSIELVDFINSLRTVSLAPVLTHADFMKKVRTVLEGVEGNFSCYYKAANGKTNPMYRFPKREATLMAMSYSSKISAQVYDKMEAPQAAIWSR